MTCEPHVQLERLVLKSKPAGRQFTLRYSCLVLLLVDTDVIPTCDSSAYEKGKVTEKCMARFKQLPCTSCTYIFFFHAARLLRFGGTYCLHLHSGQYRFIYLKRQ